MKKKLLLLLITILSPFLSFSQAPVNLQVNLVFSNSAILQWENGTCAQNNFVLSYKDSTLTTWDSIVVVNNGFGNQVQNVPALNSLTTYNWRVKCDTTWVNGPNFTTSSCFTFNYNVTDASCDGNSDGAVDLLLSGGFPPYTYSWSSPAYPWFSETTEDIDTLFPGLYYLNVTESGGCSEIDSVVVGTIDSNSINQLTSDFSINPVDTNGIWTNTTLTLVNTGCDVNLRPEFLITLDSAAITQGDLVLQWYNPLTAQFANLPYNVNPNGNAYGFWHYTSNGSNPDSTGLIVNKGASQTLSLRVKFTVPANYGLYSCIWNTQEVDSIGTIVQTLAPSDTINLSYSNCGLFAIDSLQINDITCYGSNDGSASVYSITGGFGNYTYLWSNGDTLSNATNLSAGNYYVIVSDIYSGCQDSINFDIIEATPLQLSISGTDVSCNEATDGTISATVIGNGLFSYNWSPTLPNGSSQSSYSNLSAGTYTLTVYDSICSLSISDSYTINNPDSLTYSTSSLDNRSCDSISCTGLISADLYGGTQPYQYQWSNGDTSQSISSLCAGSYSVILTDANSCQTYYDTITIIDTVGVASLSIVGTDISCFSLNNGIAEAVVSSGASYGNVSLLNYCGSGAYLSANSVNVAEVRLIGDNGDHIVNNTSSYGDTYEDFTNQYASLTPNQTYTVTIEIGTTNPNPLLREYAGAKVYADWNSDGDFFDSNEELGIINVDTVPFIADITFTVPNTLSGYVTRLRVAMQENNDSIIGPCDSSYFDPVTGTFLAPVRGGTEDYSLVVNVSQQPTFIWSNGGTTQIIDSLAAGTYICTLTDENNCVATDSITIYEPTQIIDSLTVGTIICNGGYTSASLNIIGGTPPYTENWSTNQNQIYAGNVSYTVTDSSGCQLTNLFTVSQPSPTVLTIQIVDIISCNGANDGSLYANISGGVAPFSYLWTNNTNSDSLFTDTISNLGPGRYFCTVTDSNNCVTSSLTSLSEPIAIAVLQTNTNALCYGDTNGVTILNISGGDGNYTLDAFGQTLPLLGNNIISSSQFFPGGIPAGTYPFTVTDGTGCMIYDTIIITQPDLISTINTINNISCYGLTDGSVTLNISGGTPPFVEDWSGFNPNSLAQGTYSFTVTDDNGCLFSDSITIVEPDSLTYSTSSNNISCYGLSDGNATINISGGVAPYSQDWGSSDPLALSSGMHYYIISDTNGCSLSDSVFISEPTALLVSIFSTNVTCYGGNNGTAILSISGGTPAYTENWNGFDNLALSAGNYVYTVSDTNGCSVSDSITITQSQDSLTSTLIPTNLSSCQVYDGSIDQSIIGGTPPYTYLWNNGDTTEDISGLMAGTYSVTTTDTNGCFTTASIFVDQPSDSLSLSFTTSDYNGFNISCFGDSSGSIAASTTGGYGLITYAWSTGDSISSVSNLSSGVYSVTISDTAGCTLTDSISLNSPSEFTSTYSTSDILCYGDSTGSASVIFSGGVEDYLLAWGSFTFPLLGGQNTFNSGAIIPAGIYPYSATDLNGCQLIDTITIYQADSLYTSYSLSDYNGFNISCFTGSDGQVSLNVIGGTNPYFIYFNNSQYVGPNPTIPGLNQGTYQDSIVDSNGCIYTENITLNEPPRLTSTTQLINNADCYGACNGSLAVLSGGGISPYNYIWNNDSTLISDTVENLCAGTYIVIVEDQNGCQASSLDSISQPNQIPISLDSITDNTIYGGNTGNIYVTLNGSSTTVLYNWTGPNGFSANTEDISNLYSGTYILNTTDSLGCSIDTFIVDQPLSLSASLDYITNNICWGRSQGAIAVTPDGGDSVYTYLWTGPNGFSSSDEDIDSLIAGTYTLELSDSTNTITYSFDVLENDEIIVYSNSSIADCYDGSAIVTAYGFGGTPPLDTYWSNGDTGISTILVVGTHAVTVMDVYGCNSTDSVTVEPGDSLSISTNSTMVSCYGLNDAIVSLNVYNGGIAPYQYSNDSGITYQSSNIFYNLSPGVNTFTVIDNNGCLNTVSTNLTQPLELGVDVIFTNLVCFNDCDATATAIVDNGTQPYSYEWTDPNQQLNQTAIGLCAGTYNVTVTDANGCVATEFVGIINPDPIIVNIWQYEDTLEATSGFVSYQWLDEQLNPISGETSNKFSPTQSGEYSVEVTDANGCTTISYAVSFNYTSFSESEDYLLNIYPNPTSSFIFIDEAAKISEVEIFNALGDKVLHHINEMSANQLKFNLANKTRGIYFVKVIRGNELINYKIVLQ